jgi:hypothetical protein
VSICERVDFVIPFAVIFSTSSFSNTRVHFSSKSDEFFNGIVKFCFFILITLSCTDVLFMVTNIITLGDS